MNNEEILKLNGEYIFSKLKRKEFKLYVGVPMQLALTAFDLYCREVYK